MNFKKCAKSIKTAGYNGAHTVADAVVFSSTSRSLKVIYSEKATKFYEIPCTASQIIGGPKISKNFVAFSEYMNFTSEYLFRINSNPMLTSTSHVVMFNVFGFSAKFEKRCCSESELTWRRRRRAHCAPL